MLRIGIGTECDVRFYKELFFEKFCLTLNCENGAWQIMCSDNIYIDAGDVRKLVTKKLTHGDSFKVRYQNGETELFKVEFLIDFDNAAKKYDRVIDISNLNCITIGSSSVSNIVINSPYTNNDRIELRKNGSDYQLRILSSACGVYHNGARATNNEKIKNGDFFSVAEFSFYFKNGRLMTDTNINVNGLTYYDEQQKNEYPKFNRNTRVKFVVDDEKIQVLDPPAKPQKPKNNIISRLLPSLIMVVAGLAMAAFQPFMLVSSGIGVVTAVISLIQSKKDFKTNSQERIEKYNKYIENKKAEIEKGRNDEKERKRRSKHRSKKAVSARHCANFLQCKPKYHHAPSFAEPCRRAALPPKAAAAAPHSRAKIPAAAASGPKPQPPHAASGTMPANICRATDKMLSF